MVSILNIKGWIHTFVLSQGFPYANTNNALHSLFQQDLVAIQVLFRRFTATRLLTADMYPFSFTFVKKVANFLSVKNNLTKHFYFIVKKDYNSKKTKGF